jgi:integrase
MPDVPRPLPPFLNRERSRHGKLAYYVRRDHGPRIRLKAEYDTAEFWEQYRGALDGKAPTPRAAKARSFAWAVKLYMQSAAWAELAPATRKQRGNIYRAAIKVIGDKPLSAVNEKSVIASRDARKQTPHSANNFLKAMRGLFGWACGDGKLLTTDPTKGVTLLKGENDERGFHTWTEEEVARFEARWPIGTRERLAFDILLYTGLRRGDAALLGRQHVRDGIITIRTEKNGEPVVIPMLDVLAESIAAATTGDMTFLVTERGTPFVKESFGNWFGEICRKAGCPGSAHGLRKIGATRAAENGATERQLMAIFGWTTGKMATHYTRAAENKRLAMGAKHLLLPAQPANKSARTLLSGAGAKGKKRVRSGT